MTTTGEDTDIVLTDAAPEAAPAAAPAAPAKGAAVTPATTAEEHKAHLERLKELKAIKKPDETEHEEKKKNFLAQMAAATKKKSELSAQLSGLINGRKQDSQHINQLHVAWQAAKADSAQKSAIVSEYNAQRQKSEDAKESQRAAVSQMKARLKFDSIKQIDGAIRELENRLQTTPNLSVRDEKAIIGEISQLKASKADVARFEEFKNSGAPKQELSRAQYEEARTAAATARAAAQAAFDAWKEARNAVYPRDTEEGPAQAAEKARAAEDTIRNRISDFTKQYNLVKDMQSKEEKEWRRQNDEYYGAGREINLLNKEIQRWKALHPQEKKPREPKPGKETKQREADPAEEEEEELEPSVPWEYETKKCDGLIEFLKKFKPKQVAAPVVEISSNASSSSDLFQGKKYAGEAAPVGVIAPQGSKKTAKKPEAAKRIPEAFLCPVGVLNDFKVVGVAPPLLLEQLDAAIQQLEARKDFFKTAPLPSKEEAANDIAKQAATEALETGAAGGKKAPKPKKQILDAHAFDVESEIHVVSDLPKPVQWGPRVHS